jgi:signal transduction histidine kinase
MRIRWWQSIRWRLALGSVLVSLLATGLLTLAALLAIVHFYDIDQQPRLAGAAESTAQMISERYEQIDNTGISQTARLALAARSAAYPFPRLSATTGTLRIQGDDYLFFVLDHQNKVVFPIRKQLTSKTQALPLLTRLNNSLQNPATQNDLVQLRNAVFQAQEGTAVAGEIGTPYLGVLPRDFQVEPIKIAGQSDPIGVVVMLPHSAANNTLPPFVETVASAVLVASLAVALLAALAAIFFSRTIMRPLAKLTGATRRMASGDYQAQVQTSAQGELGELASTFNEMAAQLQRDVEELRKQEVWRRELLMSITHDLATPLTAIAGLGEALADGVDQSREDYEATGRIIVRETLRLRRLVKDLHMMTKVEAGALHPQRKSVRLAALVDEVLAVLAPEFERVQVEPINAIPFTLPLVEADPDMLTRVFSNLCDNALHYTPAGGTVTIEASQRAGELFVSVADTGPGIPPDALPRIFERFFRADSARQSMTGGSGLGLAIVRAIVEAHDGRVWAENAPQGGARLLFTLPLSQHPDQITTRPLSLSNTPTAPLR